MACGEQGWGGTGWEVAWWSSVNQPKTTGLRSHRCSPGLGGSRARRGAGGMISVTGSGSPNLPSPFLVRTRTLWGGTFLRPRRPPRHHHLSPAVGPDQQQGPCGLRKQLALVFGKQSKERPNCLPNADLRKESFRVVGGGKKVQTGPRGGGAGVGGRGGCVVFKRKR